MVTITNIFSTYMHLNLDSLNKLYNCYFNEVTIPFIFLFEVFRALGHIGIYIFPILQKGKIACMQLMNKLQCQVAHDGDSKINKIIVRK